MQTISSLSPFEAHLKQHQLSVTKTRLRIINVLMNADKPLAIHELVRLCRSAHFVTVYRNVDALRKAAIITQVPIGAKNRYELSDRFKPHHHHVTCEKCGRSVSIQDAKIELLLQQRINTVGMRPTRHHIEAYGLCFDCI